MFVGGLCSEALHDVTLPPVGLSGTIFDGMAVLVFVVRLACSLCFVPLMNGKPVIEGQRFQSVLVFANVVVRPGPDWRFAVHPSHDLRDRGEVLGVGARQSAAQVVRDHGVQEIAGSLPALGPGQEGPHGAVRYHIARDLSL